MTFEEFEKLLAYFPKKKKLDVFTKQNIHQALEMAQKYTIKDVAKMFSLRRNFISDLLKAQHLDTYCDFKKNYKSSFGKPDHFLTKNDVAKIRKINVFNRKETMATTFIIRESITGKILGSETSLPEVAEILIEKGLLEKI